MLMLFVLHALDKPDHGHVRKANMAAHVAYLRASSVGVVLAGPLLGADGGAVGSMLILEAEDQDKIGQFTEQDPYTKAGLFRDVQIHAYRKTFGWNQPAAP
jgi:uncharacterized protein YciI